MQEDTVELDYRAPDAEIYDFMKSHLLPMNNSSTEEVLPRASSGDLAHGTITCFMNNEHNSRATLYRSSEVRMEWKKAIRQDYPPLFILAEDQRIIIDADVWQLFDWEGNLLKERKKGLSEFIIDKDKKVFFYVDERGRLTACNLRDGSELFTTFLSLGNEYLRTLLAFKNDVLTLAGNQLQLAPLDRKVANRSVIAKLDLRKMLQSNIDIKNTWPGDLGELHIFSNRLIAINCQDNIAFAYPGRLIIADQSLKIIAAYSNSFVPLSISTDEAARMYLLNDNDTGRFLLVLNKKGERLYSVDMPKAIVHPPIVGYDHRVFIPCEKSIAVIEQDGEQKICYMLKHNFHGAIITADDKLLVCDGPDLVAFDKNGKSTILYNFGNDELCTPPVITEEGKILVASKQFLYCLEPK